MIMIVSNFLSASEQREIQAEMNSDDVRSEDSLETGSEQGDTTEGNILSGEKSAVNK